MAFAEQMGIEYPLLSDHPKFEASKAYGVFSEDYLIATRSYFLVGTDGLIKWARIVPGAPLPNVEVVSEIKKALDL